MNTEKGFFYKELTEESRSSSYNILNTLGCGLLEKIYENLLAGELELKKKKVLPKKKFNCKFSKPKLRCERLVV
ncbi:MAG: hypothetical protein KAS99_02290 [Candidatus Omnitrophica bacterium]|nr:hypothetical protein [Candidatus Omnitrophota bacterium]